MAQSLLFAMFAVVTLLASLQIYEVLSTNKRYKDMLQVMTLVSAEGQRQFDAGARGQTLAEAVVRTFFEVNEGTMTLTKNVGFASSASDNPRPGQTKFNAGFFFLGTTDSRQQRKLCRRFEALGRGNGNVVDQGVLGENYTVRAYCERETPAFTVWYLA